jgi:vacuolar-type H+-ATPase subunit E/Vma4
VDIETRRQKQQELMVRMVERKVRERALQDWFQAESEVLENTTIAPLYRRFKSSGQNRPESIPTELSGQESAC